MLRTAEQPSRANDVASKGLEAIEVKNVNKADAQAMGRAHASAMLFAGETSFRVCSG